MFWVLHLLHEFLLYCSGRPIITPRYTRFNRPTEAFLESLNPKYRKNYSARSVGRDSDAHRDDLFLENPHPSLSRRDVRFRICLVGHAIRTSLRDSGARCKKGAMNLKTFGVLDRRVVEPQLASESSHESNGAVGVPADTLRAERVAG